MTAHPPALLLATALVVGACGAQPSTSSTAASSAASAPSVTPAPSAPSASGWIAYQAIFNGTTDLGLVRPDGSENHQLPGGPGNRWHPDWSPDGRWIAYDHDLPTDVDEIWIAAADGSGDRALTDCVAPCFGHQGAAWAPDGESVAFDSASGPSDAHPDGVCYVGRADVETGEVTRVIEFPGCAGAGEDGLLQEVIFVRFSPDGERLVGQGIGPDAQTAIFTFTAAGTELTQLTDWGLGARPDWSPDGSWIVFQSLSPEEYLGEPISLHRVRPDGSELESLTTPDGTQVDLYPRYLPDGSGILFSRCPVSRATDCDVHLLAPDGSSDRLLFSTPGRHAVHPILQPGAAIDSP